MTQSRPRMNGADDKISRLQEQVEDLALKMALVRRTLEPSEKALQELEGIYNEIETLIDKLKGIRTLTQPHNWRLLMQYDPPAYVTFLEGADESVLAIALRECGSVVIGKVERAAKRARSGDGG
jgi:hypothetical protein